MEDAPSCQDASCPHQDATCGAHHPTGWPALWMPGTRGNLGCHELQHAILLFRKSSLPECVSSHWTSGWMPMCSMRQGDNAFYPCRVNAPGCCLSVLARCCCTSASAAARQTSVRCALLKLQLQQGLQTSVTSPNFTTDLFAQPPPLSGQADPRYQKRSVIMNTSCFISVPYKGPDGASNREKHRSWYFFRYVNQHSGKYLCSILKIQADVYQTRPKKFPDSMLRESKPPGSGLSFNLFYLSTNSTTSLDYSV